ncbi:MAG: cation-translocating P-type ATPase [Phycisphaerales bacterium]
MFSAKNDWHIRSTEDVLTALSTSENGLTAVEATARMVQYGPNELQEQAGKGPLRMLLEQFTQTMVLILIAAAVVSGLLGKGMETVAIGAIVVLFGVLGFASEYRAERAMASLKQLAVPVVRVRRDGRLLEISARELVPGDIVVLETGNSVPADARLIESVNLRIQEATLTGESESVEKSTAALSGNDLPLGDRRNMVYLGTAATYGRGTAVVVETGMRTELGKIAGMIQQVVSESSPLQKQLDRVGKTLAVGGVVVSALVMFMGVLGGESIGTMFLTAVSVAVAVVPEGLPAVITITLAIGAQRMLRRNALIRKLPAVETLGSVDVICSDKTGTLTENRMTVTVIAVAGERLDLTESMHKRQPEIATGPLQPGSLGQISPAIRLTLVSGALCNDATLKPDADGRSLHAIGDPTEGALVVAAAHAGLLKDDLQAAMPRVAEFAFDSDRKRMTTVHRVPAAGGSAGLLPPLGDWSHVAFSKGAVDGLLELASQVWTADKAEPITADFRSRILAVTEDLARQGVRVLGIAFRPLAGIPADLTNELERDLIFVGLVGLMDPPRAAARSAVEMCRTAGIRPVMITGDHALTAVAIARHLTISDDPKAVTGNALSAMSDDELRTIADHTSVYARVSPADKLRIVDALQDRGHVVAMTGDGVNDSPALKKADIGVAMGITGTDVAKEASAMVLLDDNFATIVAAVREGRIIYDNLLRFIRFSLGGNLGKVLVMLGAPLLGIAVALRPLQLLWLNLLTDGLMGLGLGFEPGESDVMNRPPRRPNNPILDRTTCVHIGWVGILIGVLALGLGAAYFDPKNPADMRWQTILFASLGFAQMGQALGLRAWGYSILSITTNPMMAVVFLVTLILQLLPIYVPVLARFFGLTRLSGLELALALAVGGVTFVVVRAEKAMRRR